MGKGLYQPWGAAEQEVTGQTHPAEFLGSQETNPCGDLGTCCCQSKSSPWEVAEALTLHAGRVPWDRRHEEEVNALLWLLGTCQGALQCRIQEVGKPGRSQEVRTGTWGWQFFGFGRNQPH